MANAKNKQKKDFPIFTVFCIVIGLLLAVGITLTVLDNTGFNLKRKTVLTVGDESINALEFNYAYVTMYNNASTYLSYFGVDTKTDGWENGQANASAASLLGITVSEGDTWKQAFVNAAAESLKTELALYQLAKADENYTIDYDTINKSIDNKIDTDTATAGNYKVDLKTLYSSSYGKGFNESTMRHMLEYSYVANAYQTNYKDGLNYDDAALEKYYGENKSTYDVYTFLALDFAYETPKTDDDSSSDSKTTEASEAEKKAKADAEAYVEANKESEEVFTKGNEKVVKSERKTSSEASSLVGSDGQKWLTDSERKAGDTAVVKGTDKYIALYYIGSERDEYKLANIRIIRLDPTVADKDKGATDEELKALKEKAESVLAALDKTPTEDNFKELASKNSADSSTSSKGGLYEDFAKTTAKGYSSELAEWVFAGDRVKGEYKMFEGSKKYYIVYYLSSGEIFWKKSAESNLRSTDTNNWTEKCVEGFKDRTEYDSAKAFEIIGG